MLQAGIDFTFPPKGSGAIRARLQYMLQKHFLWTTLIH